ncbi:hypothetical protein R69888_05118 [Paraburkholderia haematera]|uniref:Uncharacterized protein n=1 Tax=Paraburkholderia haematera TaxID=2793077 RepID=A0ABN7MIP5_9BURK|nr:hypothetical protein R69888_05118 [Paraburkholderia haematera]
MSLNVPAEYGQGFIKSGQQFWRTLAGLEANGDLHDDTHAGATPPEASVVPVTLLEAHSAYSPKLASVWTRTLPTVTRKRRTHK